MRPIALGTFDAPSRAIALISARARIAAACSIDPRTGAWRGSVQAPGLSL